MTWLTRLLPQPSSLKGRAPRRDRTTRKRLRAMTVEDLEHRIVLSNVSTSVAGTVLTIDADRFNNSFRVVESTASGPDHGKVTVESTFPSTTINGTLAPFQTDGAITAIKINLVGTTDSDDIEIVGAGKSATTTVKTVDIAADKTYLTLDVHDVGNSGAFNLTTKGKLDATLADDTFGSLTIDQSQGCCVAHVELSNVTAGGAVTISEGQWNGTSVNHNSVDIHDSKLGATIITQGDGDRNTAEVADSTLKWLYVSQGDGDDDSIDIHGLRIASTGSGITAVQGDGDDDSTAVDDVAVAGLITNDPDLVPSINIFQANGDGDIASITNVDVPGNININQGSGDGDQAAIADSFIGRVYQGSYLDGNVTISQAGGLRDVATIDDVVANSTYIYQGDGDEDYASITDSTIFVGAGIWQGNGGDVVDPQPDGSDADPDLIGDQAYIDGVTGVYYNIYIIQGDGDGDVASITNSDPVYGSVYIIQGDGAGDDAFIGSVAVGDGQIYIFQGDGDGDVAQIDESAVLGNGDGDDYGSIFIQQRGGDEDSASITNSTAIDSIFISQGDGDGDFAAIDNSWNVSNSITIYQGDGDDDYAVIRDCLSAWQISITQGDGVLDTAAVVDSSAIGYSDPMYDQAGNILYWIDYYGEITISQGDGYGDQAIVDGMYAGADYTATDVVVFQGNNIATPDCDGYPGDAVYINNAVIVSDLSIYQGHAPNGDEAAPVGGYSVYIAAGSPYGDPGDVVAGGFTYITQYGGGNTVVMGSDGSAFSTVYLDVYTGADGGGFVMATNVSVDWGSFYGLDFSIDGGGDGNVYVDAGGNSGFGASGDYSTVTL